MKSVDFKGFVDRISLPNLYFVMIKEKGELVCGN